MIAARREHVNASGEEEREDVSREDAVGDVKKYGFPEVWNAAGSDGRSRSISSRTEVQHEASARLGSREHERTREESQKTRVFVRPGEA